MSDFIQTFSPEVQKVKAVVYGASGAGKTHFAATAPKPYFVNAENGLLSAQQVLSERGEQVQGYSVKTVEQLRGVLNFLKTGDHPFETVVIDSISEINEIIKEKIEREKGRSMQLQDWGEVAKTIKMILRSFRDLDMHVIFIAQETNEKDDTTIQRIVPLLNGKAATEIAYYMDIVAYAYVNKDGGNSIMTEPNQKLLTKDRSGKTNDLPADFSAWIDAICSSEPVQRAEPKPEVKLEEKPTKRWGKGVKKVYQEVEVAMKDLAAYLPNIDPTLWEALLKKRIEADYQCEPIDMTLDQVQELHARITKKLEEEQKKEEEEMSKEPTEVLEDGKTRQLSEEEVADMFSNAE